MSNPLIYGKVLLPNNDTAAAPSVQVGGSINSSSGTGIYGDEANVKISVGGSLKATIDASGITGTIVGQSIVVITSAASAGGAATEAMTLTGLLTTDTILSVTQKTKGVSNLPLLGYSTQATNALTAIWSADPGAGAVIVVAVKR